MLTCPRSCLRLFTRRSPPRLLNAAARAGLGPAPESRSRWVYHHLPRSFNARFSVHIEPLSAHLQRTLLFCINRNDWLVRRQKRLGLGIDVIKLRVAIDVLAAFSCLAVRLQAIAHAAQKVADDRRAGRMPFVRQLVREINREASLGECLSCSAARKQRV